MTQLTANEIKQLIISILYAYHDANGLHDNGYSYDELYNVLLQNRDITRGRIDLVMKKLKLLEIIDTLDVSHGPIYTEGGSTVSLNIDYYESLVEESDKTKNIDIIQEKIILENHETICQSIDNIVEAVDRNNEVSDEARHVGKGLKESGKFINERAGEVSKTFIDLIKRCLQTLYKMIIGIDALSNIASKIKEIIESLGL